MIYQVHALVRLPRITHEAFLRHWTGTHAPLVLSLAADLRIRSYRVMPAMPGPVAAEGGYDGFAIVGFADMADFTAMLATPEGRAAARRIREDEKLFFDSAASSLTWAEAIDLM